MRLWKFLLLLAMAKKILASEYLRKENNSTETNKWYSGADGCNYGGISIGVAGGGA